MSEYDFVQVNTRQGPVLVSRALLPSTHAEIRYIYHYDRFGRDLNLIDPPKMVPPATPPTTEVRPIDRYIDARQAAQSARDARHNASKKSKRPRRRRSRRALQTFPLSLAGLGCTTDAPSSTTFPQSSNLTSSNDMHPFYSTPYYTAAPLRTNALLPIYSFGTSKHNKKKKTKKPTNRPDPVPSTAQASSPTTATTDNHGPGLSLPPPPPPPPRAPASSHHQTSQGIHHTNSLHTRSSTPMPEKTYQSPYASTAPGDPMDLEYSDASPQSSAALIDPMGLRFLYTSAELFAALRDPMRDPLNLRCLLPSAQASTAPTYPYLLPMDGLGYAPSLASSNYAYDFSMAPMPPTVHRSGEVCQTRCNPDVDGFCRNIVT